MWLICLDIRILHLQHFREERCAFTGLNHNEVNGSKERDDEKECEEESQ
jgi:hypothetical protein